MPLTLDEIDDALAKAWSAPEDERGPVWVAWVDSLLDVRIQLDLANSRK